MKKILQLTKVITLMLAAVIMFSGTNVLTAHAETINNTPMLPNMDKTEYGIRVKSGTYILSTDTKTGKTWSIYAKQLGYPFCTVRKTFPDTLSNGTIIESESIFLDCYLTDYIQTHDKSEWPSFVITGTDGVPFYLYNLEDKREDGYHFTKYCYDEVTGWWLRDAAYDGAKAPFSGVGPNASANADEELAQIFEELKEDIAAGEVIENGTPVDPIVPDYINDVIYSDDAPTYSFSDHSLTYPDGHVEYPDGGHDIYDEDGKKVHCYDKHIVYPDGRAEYYCGDKLIRIEYPDGRVENLGEHEKSADPFADINTLGAAVTFKTDCIKTKKNNAPQKPLPKSVKVGNKALKKDKTFTVSYERHSNIDGWETVDAVTYAGTYRIVITGKNGYEGVYKKRLYVTADNTIKAMSSASVKVNKMPYTGEPITSGVIKTAKIGKRVLVEGTDYTVTYKNNTDSGSAQVILTAVEGSGLLGTKTVNFTITGNKMSKAKASGISGMTYNPNEIMEQDMSQVKLTYNGTALTQDTDFTVSYVNNAKAGTAKIVFTGKGLYNGTLTKSFKIAKAPLSESMLDDASKNIEVTYTGKPLKPDVTLKNGDTTLKKDTDYTLTYKNNVKVSTDAAPAQITVKGKGSYTGSFKLDFSIVEKKNDNTGKTDAKNVKPDAGEPTGEETVTDEPTDDENVTDEATGEEPAADEPTEDEPVADEPTGDEPAADEPTGDEPAADEPTEDKPVTDEPTVGEPAIDEPTGDKPVADEPTVDEPAIEEPTGDEPVTDEPIEDKPAEDEPTDDESATDEPTIDKPATDEFTEDKSVTVTDEPAADIQVMPN